ncbi:MAG: hypothetical protein P4N59_01690 [Negativicutes bacterium]|nr:hypothetical protein [Negativicutes bacterium]
MKITSSSVAMSSQHVLTELSEQTSSPRAWNNGQSANHTASGPRAQVLYALQKDAVNISDRAKQLWQAKVRALHEVSGNNIVPNGLNSVEELKIKLISDFIYILTGKRVKIVSIDPQQLQANTSDEAVAGSASSQAAPSYGWGVAFHFHQTQSEQEQTDFGASGVVKTADGQEINFSLNMTMSRQFESEQDVSVKAGDAAIDPLTINFDQPAATLTDKKYSFDLNADGSQEQISFVGSGSGFLALDRNGDGKINDGTELYGPASGNGFAELAKNDSDGNGWIDENDPIFAKLKIWTKDAAGNDQLSSLEQKGVGAIYLGNVNTSFSIKSDTNELQGQVRQSGVFLREDGSAGTVQQVDLAV